MNPLTTVRLFKALEVTAKKMGEVSKFVLTETLSYGFVFSPEVAADYDDLELYNLTDQIKAGLSPEEMNSSFHKSWSKIKDADMEQLFRERAIHYFTTYGLERLGLYEEGSVYIPDEQLDIPDVKLDKVKIVVIRGYTREEIKEKVLGMLRSGIALHENTMKDVVEVCKDVGVGQENIKDIKNKEVKIALCDHLGIFPEDPVEFLRYVLFVTTGKTLLIKNAAMIAAIKEGKGKGVPYLFGRYETTYGLSRLSEIFYRFKPLFLAFKSTGGLMRPCVNRIRKLAYKHHEPMPWDYLNDITHMIKNNVVLNLSALERHLKKATIFRKIRLAYALKYRTTDADSILYKIRNGKGFASDFHFENKQEAGWILDIVFASIVEDMRKNVKGKKIYIPESIKYALPATEKQFTGFFPSGSYVRIPKDMVFGVHWNNVKSKRIDLDLSLINSKGEKFGWDAGYRNRARSLLFSGDVTNASHKNGATELFYVERRLNQEFIMFVNYFNFEEGVEVPFDILVAEKQLDTLKKNYMVDPNDVKAMAKTKINERQKILGLLVTTKNECRFYFSETTIGMSITAGWNDHVKNSLKYLSAFYKNSITLNTLLTRAGAILVEEGEEYDLDLSPEVLEKDTIISLLQTI